MKAIKKIFKYLSIFILVLLIALISAPFMFKGKLIEIAKEQINEQVNAKIEFGEFDLSIFSTFPNLLFEINNVKVSGVDKFEGKTLFKMDKLGAKVDIMSVFGNNIKVIGILLDRPIINAIVLPDSSANWDIAKASTDTVATEIEENEAPTTDGESGSFKLSLKSFEINNADIAYNDMPGNMSATIEGLTFALSGDLGSETTELVISTLVKKLTFKQDGVKLVNKAELAYNAELDADLVNSKYTFKENIFRINALELAFDGFVQMMENEDINLDIKFNTNKPSFKSLLSMVPAVYMTDFANVQTKGNLELKGFANGTYNENTLPAFDLTLKVGDAMFKYPDLPAAATNIAIDLNINNKDGVEDHTVINLKKFHVELADNPIDFRLLTKTPISDPYIDGNLKANIDFEKLKTVVPLDSMSMTGTMTSNISFKGNLSTIEQERYEDFHAEGLLALNNFVFKSADFEQGLTISETELEFTPQYVALNKFATQIGKSDISADGRIDNLLSYYFKEETLKAEFNVNSNLLDANEFMSDEETATTETAETTTEQTATTTETTQEAGVIEIPKNIDFKLNTNFKKVLYEDLVITDVNGSMSLKEGVASMDNLKMNMLDGSLNLSGNYSTKDITKPSASMVFGINDFDIRKTYDSFKVIQESAPIAKNCAGKFTMILNYESLLNDSMMPVMETVNGGGVFSSKQITIDNSDVFNKLAALLQNDKYKTLELNDLNIKFKIIDGNIEVEPFKTKSGKTEFEIGGKQGIDQTLDYKMNIKIPSSELGSSANEIAGKLSALAGANGLNVNMPEFIDINGLITGTVQKPKISLDLKQQGQNVVEDIKEQVKEVVKQEIDKAKKQAIEEAKKQAAKLLAEAKKQANTVKKTAQQTATSIRSNGKKAGNDIRKEAQKQGDKLIKDAGMNPLKKAAAKEAAKQLNKEADKKANNVENEANNKANKVVSEANKKADGIVNTAKQQGDDLIKKAENV